MEPNEIMASDETVALKEIAKFSSAAFFLLKRASSLEIESREGESEALEISGMARKLHSEIEYTRKKAIEPYRTIISIVNDSAKALTSQLDELGEAVKVKLAIWHSKLEDDAQEAREKAAELSKQLGIDIYTTEAPKTLSNEHAVASMKTKWVWNILDEYAAPREYLIIDEKRVSEAVKMGARDIPGIKIYQSSEMTIRRR